MAARPSPTNAFHTTTYPALDPTRPELSAKGKHVVITGGGTGIGAETALHFARAGASSVAILGRREQPLSETKAAIHHDFPNVVVFAIPTDVTKQDEVDKAFATFSSGKEIDVLVSNAGTLGTMGLVKDLDVNIWFEGIEQSVKSSFVVAKTFVKFAAKDAVLINVSSAAVHRNVAPGASSYAVNKAAAWRFFDALVYEYPDLYIFNVQPGVIATAMSQQSKYPPRDDISLPASFMVWLASSEAHFLKGKFLWANWDVQELMDRAEEIEDSRFLNVDLVGWPFQ